MKQLFNIAYQLELTEDVELIFMRRILSTLLKNINILLIIFVSLSAGLLLCMSRFSPIKARSAEYFVFIQISNLSKFLVADSTSPPCDGEVLSLRTSC